MDSIRRYIGDVRDVLTVLPFEGISDVIDLLLSVNYVGGQVFTMGNGGSAATASHFACDLGKGTIVPDRSRFRVIALTDAMPVMTAWSNDVDYADVFAQQLDNFIQRGDVVVAFSGSGNSSNVLRAIDLARQVGGITVGFSGFAGGELSGMVDIPIVVPSDCMEQIEDIHLILCHLICTVLRERLRKIEPPISLSLYADTPRRLKLETERAFGGNGSGKRGVR